MKENECLMAAYSLVHLSAAVVTSIVIIRLVGMRVFYWIEVWKESWMGKREDLFLFWGINRQSVVLAESIKRGRIVFVNKSSHDMDDFEVDVHGILDIIKIRQEAEDRLCAIKAMVVNCKDELSEIGRLQGKCTCGM